MESLGRPEDQAQGMNENKGCSEAARSTAKIVAQKLSRALPWPQNPGKLGLQSGPGLNGDWAVAATLESVHGCHSCCHPHWRRFSKGFSLCL